MNEQENQPTTVNRQPAADTFWLVACTIITAIAAFLRFYNLELKPLHHDEGVNGYFMMTLFREGIYRYDPQNYHGPTLYYFALSFSKIFGLNTLSVRASVAIFGVLTVMLAFFLKKYIGKIGSLAAALFLALSPGMVFISRYFIHEMLFVFFSFAIVVGIMFFVEKRRAGIVAIASMTFLLLVCFLPSALNLANAVGNGDVTLSWIVRIGLLAVEAVLIFLIMRMIIAWNGGRAIYLILTSASAVLLFATKETAFITIGTTAIACVCVWIWRKIYRAMFGEPKENELEPVELTWANFRGNLGNSGDLMLLVVVCAVAFAYVGILFFSSFFTYSEGIGKAFEAYALWTKT
ncbi:MAG TPA: flippase activity-associated protein Agl23, partial [Pyrinomonadaceae bacterium]|nr:flippase activity-associated protein Agl23 [Pyrinomonadaceae bacterium]